MPGREPEQWGVTLVLRGRFNPLIFTPHWLEKKKLISSESLQHAVDTRTIEVIHPEIVQYRVDRFSVQVRPDIFMVETAEDPTVTVFDLAMGCFSELPETPVRMAGINYAAHIGTTFENLDKIGDILAPKETWDKILGDKNVHTREGGMHILVMRSPRESGPKGYTDWKVEPSVVVKPGVFISANDHYEIPVGEVSEGALPMMEIVKEHWDASIKRSRQIVGMIMELGN